MAHAPTDPRTAALRAEHDDLARRLEARASVDQARRGLVLLAVAFVATGVSWAFLWDRYAKVPSEAVQAHPGWFTAGYLATGLLAVVLWVAGAVALARRGRLARDEAALFSRLQELRRKLELDL
jgi:hypothetical protein